MKKILVFLILTRAALPDPVAAFIAVVDMNKHTNNKIDLYNLFLISYLAPFYMQILYNNKFLRLQQKE